MRRTEEEIFDRRRGGVATEGCCEPCDAAEFTQADCRARKEAAVCCWHATRTLKTRTTIIRHLIVTRPAKILLKNTLLR